MSSTPPILESRPAVPAETVVDDLIEEYAAGPRSSARTLLATIFGDSVEAHGGIVWLGSMIDLVDPLRISERLVRTSIHRLVLEGFLVARQVGRRSYYSLTDSARRDFGNAERRVYHRAPRLWDGEWTLVITPEDLAPEARTLLTQRLDWLGFGRLNAGTWAHPTSPLPVVAELVAGLELGDSVVVLRGRHPAGREAEGINIGALTRRCCALDDVSAAYRTFVVRYEPVLAHLAEAGPPGPAPAFLLRTVLVDDYRRIVLRDPQLPDPLLPPKWVGDEAYRLVASLYRLIARSADVYLEANALTIAGPIPPVTEPFLARFGGF